MGLIFQEGNRLCAAFATGALWTSPHLKFRNYPAGEAEVFICIQTIYVIFTPYKYLCFTQNTCF